MFDLLLQRHLVPRLLALATALAIVLSGAAASSQEAARGGDVAGVPTPAPAPPAASEGAPRGAAAPRPPAESDKAAPPPRVLDGHAFIPPIRFPSALVTTHLALSIGGSYTTFPSIAARNDKVFQAAIAEASQRLELGVRVHPRVAIVAGFGTALVAGVDSKSAANFGAEGLYSWMLGAEGVMARFDRTGTQLGARLTWEGSRGVRVLAIERLVQDAVDARKAPPLSRLFGTHDIMAARFSLNAAQAFGRHFSAQASVGWVTAWTSTDDRPAEHRVDPTAGLALVADAAPYVPMALLAEYDVDRPARRRGERSSAPAEVLSDMGAHSFIAGLYFSGRADLSLGVLGGAQFRERIARSNAVGRFEMRYFF